MKRFALLLLSLLTARLGYGQRTEYALHLTSGFAAYRGSGAAVDGSVLVVPDPLDVFLVSDREEPYTENPYGTAWGVSYGLAAQVQRVAPKGGVWGVQTGYEVLRSRVRIHNVFDRHDFGTSSTGYTALFTHGINTHPFFGHRFAVKSTQVDLTAGPEVSVLLRSHERGDAQTARTTYSTRLEHGHPGLDVRARVNATAYYQHLGLTLGYSHGFTDYRKTQAGVNGEAYLQAFRLGLLYRL
jgi:hypothetical protein